MPAMPAPTIATSVVTSPSSGRGAVSVWSCSNHGERDVMSRHDASSWSPTRATVYRSVSDIRRVSDTGRSRKLGVRHPVFARLQAVPHGVPDTKICGSFHRHPGEDDAGDLHVGALEADRDRGRPFDDALPLGVDLGDLAGQLGLQ